MAEQTVCPAREYLEQQNQALQPTCHRHQRKFLNCIPDTVTTISTLRLMFNISHTARVGML